MYTTISTAPWSCSMRSWSYWIGSPALGSREPYIERRRDGSLDPLTHHARLDPSANDGRRRSVPFRHQGEPDAAPALGRGAFLRAPRVSSGLPRPRRRVQLQQNYPRCVGRRLLASRAARAASGRVETAYSVASVGGVAIIFFATVASVVDLRLCLAVTREDPRERVTCCFRDGSPQDRRHADRDVGDHRRSREHPAAKVGQRSRRVPSRLAAVAFSAHCRGSPPNRVVPNYIRRARRARTWTRASGGCYASCGR